MGAPQVVGDRLGMIAGSGVPHDLVGDLPATEVRTGWGTAQVVERGDLVVLRRHGPDHAAPHQVDHRANLAALAATGCNRILAVASVGSLRTDWPVGTVVAPDDFFAPAVTTSYHDDAAGHRVPGFDGAWRSAVIEAWRQASTTPVVDGGTYAQTTGPRFETPAEVRFLATVADVVGMTLATEVMLAGEVGLALAAVCIVDNLANGLADVPLTPEAFAAGVAANRRRLHDDLTAVLAVLSAPEPP